MWLVRLVVVCIVVLLGVDRIIAATASLSLSLIIPAKIVYGLL